MASLTQWTWVWVSLVCCSPWGRKESDSIERLNNSVKSSWALKMKLLVAYFNLLLLLLSRSVVSDSVRPHRRQPTRLPRPWDSPGKDTGVGCHFLLQCMKSEKWKWSRSVVSDSATPWTAAHQAPPSMGFSRQQYRSGVPLPSPYFNLTMA